MIFFIFIAIYCHSAGNILHFVLPAIAIIFRVLYIRNNFLVTRLAFGLPIISAFVIVFFSILSGMLQGGTFDAIWQEIQMDFIYVKIPLSMFLLIVLLQNSSAELIYFLRYIPIIGFLVLFMERGAVVLSSQARESIYSDSMLYRWRTNKIRLLVWLREKYRQLLTIMGNVIDYTNTTSSVVSARGELPDLRLWKDTKNNGEIVGDAILVLFLIGIMNIGLERFVPEFFRNIIPFGF